MNAIADRLFRNGFWRKCTECGKTVREKYDTEAGDSFCPNCGHTFDDTKDEYAVVKAYPAK